MELGFFVVGFPFDINSPTDTTAVKNSLKGDRKKKPSKTQSRTKTVKTELTIPGTRVVMPHGGYHFPGHRPSVIAESILAQPPVPAATAAPQPKGDEHTTNRAATKAARCPELEPQKPGGWYRCGEVVRQPAAATTWKVAARRHRIRPVF